jgi:trigger factor
MKATIEDINTVQRRVSITVPVETVNKAFDSAYKKIQRKSKIPGFRPGKAPLNIIKRSYGASVAGEVGESLINENLFGALQEHEVKPIASPMVEAAEAPQSDAEYKFSAVVDVMPTIELKDHKGLTVSVKEYTVGKDSLDRELKTIARRSAKTTPLADDTVAAKGHLLTVSHTATVDGKNLDAMTVHSIPVALGEKEVFPELETGMIGMKKSETKTIKLTLPKDYGDAELANKELEFTVTAEGVAELEIPAIDDELAKDMNFADLKELKAKIEESLEQNVKDMRSRDLEAALMDAVRAKNNFEVPPAMVEQVTDGIIREMGINDEKILKQAMADQDLRKSMREEAKKRAQNTMLLWEVAKAEDIKIEDDAVKEHIRTYLNESGTASDDQIDGIFKNAADRIRENLLLEKALEAMTNSATITNIPTEI